MKTAISTLLYVCTLGITSPAPKDMIQVDVVAVLMSQDGPIMMLRTHEKAMRYLPIWIGEMEALNLKLRLDHQRTPRPMTLDLLQSVLDSGDIRVVKAQIDSVSSGVYVGSLWLEHDGKIWQVDARSSDAFGLAVGNGAPMYVNSKVLDLASISAEEINTEKKPQQGYEESL